MLDIAAVALFVDGAIGRKRRARRRPDAAHRGTGMGLCIFTLVFHDAPCRMSVRWRVKQPLRSLSAHLAQDFFIH